MTAVQRLRKIVADAKGGDLERCQREADWGFHASQELLPEFQRRRAEWQAASDMLEHLLELEAAQPKDPVPYDGD